MSHREQKYTPAAVRHQAKTLRKSQTPAEGRLWEALRNRRLNGLKFRRQHPIGPFVADFYYAEGRLVIEVDGGIHDSTVEEDQSRTQVFQDHGYRVIRFRNEAIENNLEHVLSAIQEACKPPLQAFGEGVGGEVL